MSTCGHCAYFRLGVGHVHGLCHVDPPQMVGVTADGKSPLWMRPAVKDTDSACKWFVTPERLSDLRENNTILGL